MVTTYKRLVRLFNRWKENRAYKKWARKDKTTILGTAYFIRKGKPT